MDIPEVSIVILSYNVKQLLLDCLESIFESRKKGDNWQVIVVDNASTDGSVAEVKSRFKEVDIIESKKNAGFAAGNNLAIPKIKSDLVLFLNPDTLVEKDTIAKSVEFMRRTDDAGALTCKVLLPNGALDYSCHRGLPTPWNSFTYFTGLAKLFPSWKLFSGYTATYLDLAKTHEIECGSGTYFLVKREAGEKVGWWDEDYFWNGEDLEFCFRLREAGWKIYFFPEVKITHFKSSSSGLWSTAKTVVPKETKIKSAKSAAAAMRIFFHKHYYQQYPVWGKWLVDGGINLLERMRIWKISRGIKYE